MREKLNGFASLVHCRTLHRLTCIKIAFLPKINCISQKKDPYESYLFNQGAFLVYPLCTQTLRFNLYYCGTDRNQCIHVIKIITNAHTANWPRPNDLFLFSELKILGSRSQDSDVDVRYPRNYRWHRALCTIRRRKIREYPRKFQSWFLSSVVAKRHRSTFIYYSNAISPRSSSLL